MTLKIVLPCDLSTWPSVCDYLSVLESGVSCSNDLVVVLLRLHDLCNVAVGGAKARPHDEGMFDGLTDLIDRQWSQLEQDHFYTITLPCMARYASALGHLKTDPFSLCLAHVDQSMKLDRRLVASLSANVFFSTMPIRSPLWLPALPDLNFSSVYGMDTDYSSLVRLGNLFAYFDVLASEGTCGRITYERRKLHNNKTSKPVKKLAPVFVIEEPRPLDMYANLDSVVVQDLSSSSSSDNCLLQHPELIIALLAFEQLDGDEWLSVRGLLYNSSQASMEDDDCHSCLVASNSPLLLPSQIQMEMERCLEQFSSLGGWPEEEAVSLWDLGGDGSSSIDKLPFRSTEESLPHLRKRSKRQCFEDRLKEALERGNTPEDESILSRRSRHFSADDSSNSTSYSGESAYSFESQIVAQYDLDGDYEHMCEQMTDRPYHCDPLRRIGISLLQRKALSDSMTKYALHMDKMTAKAKHPGVHHRLAWRPYNSFDLASTILSPDQHCQSAITKPPAVVKNEGPSKRPLWIVVNSSSSSNNNNSKSFLVQWLAASLADIPLIVYQATGPAADVVAAVCAWIEEQEWTTDNLSQALVEPSENEMLLM